MEIEDTYSENLIATIGRKGLHIFDKDNEKWIFNSNEKDHSYEHIYINLENGEEIEPE